MALWSEEYKELAELGDWPIANTLAMEVEHKDDTVEHAEVAVGAVEVAEVAEVVEAVEVEVEVEVDIMPAEGTMAASGVVAPALVGQVVDIYSVACSTGMKVVVEEVVGLDNSYVRCAPSTTTTTNTT
jgi:hypothetical protein